MKKQLCPTCIHDGICYKQSLRGELFPVGHCDDYRHSRKQQIPATNK